MGKFFDSGEIFENFLSLGTFQKITFSHAKKNHYMMLSSEYIQIDGSVIQDQYSEWKRQLLHENKDKDTLDIWTTDGELVT